MIALITKELRSFFSSPIGYLVIAFYLVINGLFLWVFAGDLNILHAGFADLESYFVLAPWIFLFLIPAITMRSFADEIQSGTIELLKTLPLSSWQLILGKFFGGLILVLLAIAPTLIYVFSIHQLGQEVGNLSYGTTLGSFIGLLFLAATYTAVGMFASLLSKNQIVSFLIAVLVSFVLFYGFDLIAETGLFGINPYLIQSFSLNEHFKSIAKGVIDTRDLVYFSVLCLLFLKLAQLRLSNSITLKTTVYNLFGALLIIVISNQVFERFDLTEDKRYTLSDVTNEMIQNVDKIMTINVYLNGDFPTEFKRLQVETRQYLDELKTKNRKLIVQFIDPIDIGQELVDQGLEPSTLQVQENGKISELVIFPWATISYGEQQENILLLTDVYSNSQNDQLEASIRNLEYAFTSAISRLIQPKSKAIAVLKGNGELNDAYLADFLGEVGQSYRLAPFTLDAVATDPQNTAIALNEFELIIVAKPTERFSEQEKLLLDQYIINGGRSLWLVDPVHAELDSLMATGESLAYARDLNLTDLFFSYGARINYDLIRDRFCTAIALATGKVGNQTQFNTFPWMYNPLSPGIGNHLITKNIQPVNHQFVSSIDTLPNGIDKTVLLRSSPNSMVAGAPIMVNLNSIRNFDETASYNDGLKATAVLLEGEFSSAYANRTLPHSLNNYKKQGNSAMIIISDGDMIANDLDRGIPIELGLNKWTNERYGNKEFLLNSINYLLGDTDILNVRSKSIKLQFLNKEKAYAEAGKWQLINLIVPLLLLAVFGLSFNYLRKKRYRRAT